MTMLVYRIILLLVLIAGIWFFYAAGKRKPEIFSNFWQWIQKQWSETIDILRNWNDLTLKASFNIVRKFVYFISLISLLLLGLTGFIPVFITGHHLSGFLLVIHVAVAPIFAIGVALIVILASQHHRFNKDDWLGLQDLLKSETEGPQEAKNIFAQKIFYWLSIIVVIPTILSILLSMYPIFGTQGQEYLLQLHRYSALLLAVIAGGHMYLLLLKNKQGT